jgi:hypothetical protein
VAILSDFGTADSYVAEMKGVMLCINPLLSIVDLTHEVHPGDIRQAAFVLWRSYRCFPSDTVFLCVVDPGVGTARRVVAVSRGDRLFVGPDNGIFTMIVDSDDFRCHEITRPDFRIEPSSRTFQGRDIMAPACAYLSLGVAPTELGPEVVKPVRLKLSAPKIGARQIAGEVISIDRFGNAITNIPAQNMQADNLTSSTTVYLRQRKVGPIMSTYSQVGRGKPVAYVGSCGLLELAINQGSLSRTLRVARGTKVKVEFHGD